MPFAQFSQQTILLQYDHDVHFGDDTTIILAKAGGDIIDTITLRVDWPNDLVTSSVQNSTGTAMIDRVELLYKDQLIERHYGESMFILGDVTVPEGKQSALSNLVGVGLTSNLASYFIQFPFSIKVPICALDEAPRLRVVFQPSVYFAGVTYTNPIKATLYVNYIYVSKAEREYLQNTQLFYPVRTIQRVTFRVPYTETIYSCDTEFVNMVKEIFWSIQPDQYTPDVYNYSSDIVSLRLTLDGDEIISDDFGTGPFLTILNKHTRIPTSNIYSYSFELDPESLEPNGAMNMSAVTCQRHRFVLTPSPVWRTLRIYAHSYNIFCVDKKEGRVLYPLREAGVDVYTSDIIVPYVSPQPPPPPLYIFSNTFTPSQSYLYFGQTVALNDTATAAIIGAAGTGQNTGVVVVYKNNTSNVIPGYYGPGSYFGYSVDISDDGNSVIVGTPAAGNGHGAVDVYTYAGGVWTSTSLTSFVADFTYGWSVAINGAGDTALVGAPRALGFAGYACVFRKIGGIWGAEAPLVSTAGSPTAFFGYSVSLSADGNTAVVGAPSARYAAVYTYSGSMWSMPVVLNASTLSASVNFGWSVYMSPTSETVIVGAPNAEYAGVYKYSGGSWGTATKLKSTAGAGAEFGSAVSLADNGTVAIVGASIKGYAAAYIYSGGVWSDPNLLANNTGDPNSRFGSAVSLSHDGSTALVGAYGYSNANGYAAIYTST